jgi:hypothetical protein
MDAAKEKIIILFFIKDFGFIIYYLKLQIERDRQARIIYFTQTAHIDRIFEETEIQNCRFINIFINSKLQLQKISKLLIKRFTRGESINYYI